MCVRRAVATAVKNEKKIHHLLSKTTTIASSTTTPFFSHQQNHHRQRIPPRFSFLLSANAAILAALNSNPVLAEENNNNDNDFDDDGTQLRKIDDGSVISNIHTSKWRVFTDEAMKLFLQGKLDDAEKLFLGALQEAKQGFGNKDPHVASASNNLAELYRVKKLYVKAEPLYLEAISILEESYGPEDIRVGSACHNLGQFYIVQRKLDEAAVSYERALKIKRRVLGVNHLDYADTMYHLGMVLHLQGKEKDSEALIQDSIRILEDGGQGESITCFKRMRYLAQIYLKSNRFEEAEKVQRKTLHIMELTKGWNALDTVIIAEGLALILQSIGNLKEAEELLGRCLDARKTLLPHDHIQVGANLLHIARVAMLNSDQLKKIDFSKAISELDKATEFLHESIRIAQCSLDKFIKQNRKVRKYGSSGDSGTNGRVPLVILLQSSEALALVEISKKQLHGSQQSEHAENALSKCISAYKEFVTKTSISESPEIKTEYLKCLKHLLSLSSNSSKGRPLESTRVNLQDLRDEIKCLEVELSPYTERKI